MELLDEEWEGGAWINDEISNYTYDGAGHALERFKDDWQGGVWVDYLWNQYSYDGSWNEIEDWVQIWQGGTWENHEKYLQAWNANNQVTEKIYQEWEGSAWENVDRETYTYGEAGVQGEVLPQIVSLSNFPNPFNPLTTISYKIFNAHHVNLGIYNLKGQLVKTLVNEEVGRGTHSVTWNGLDNNGSSVTSGVYFYILNLDTKISKVRKCLLLK